MWDTNAAIWLTTASHRTSSSIKCARRANGRLSLGDFALLENHLPARHRCDVLPLLANNNKDRKS